MRFSSARLSGAGTLASGCDGTVHGPRLFVELLLSTPKAARRFASL